MPLIKGFATERNQDYTIKISKNAFLNIYIKRPVVPTLLNIGEIILKFYKFVSEKTGYEFCGFKGKISNVQASFEHHLNHSALVKRRQYLEKNNINFIDLKEELQFKHKGEHGTITLFPNRGTIITKDFLEFYKFVTYIQENILF